MSLISLGFLFFFVLSTLCDVWNPCNSLDLPCLRPTQSFLNKISAGIPALKIVPIDPIVIEKLIVNVGHGQGDVRLKDVNVVGLKNAVIKSFMIDIGGQEISLGMEAKLQLEGHIVDSYSSPWAKHRPYYSRAVGLVTTRYNYELITGRTKNDTFKVGPETMKCVISEPPVTALDDETKRQLFRGSNRYIPISVEEEIEIKKQLACATFKAAFSRVIANLRTMATFSTKEKFFKDC